MTKLHRVRLRGTTLIEALVTVLVLGLAALAFAQAQLRGAATNSSALWRSKANVLAGEAADRLRANPAGLAAGHYNSLTTAAADPGCTTSSVCTPAQMATADFARWRTALANALPGGSGVICLDSSPGDGTAAAPACDGPGGQLAIKVFWSERGQASLLVNVVRP